MLHDFYELISHWWVESALARIGNPPSAGWRFDFLSRAAYYGLWRYVDADLKLRKKLSTYDSACLLCYALDLLQPPKFTHSDLHILDPNMVSALLEHGANPNEYGKDGHIVWQMFLHGVADAWKNRIGSENIWINYSRVIQVLLKYSPEPVPCAWNPRCPLFPKDRGFLSLDSVINDVFSRKFPEEAAALRSSLEIRRLNTAGKRKQEIAQDLIVGKRKRLT